MSQFANEAATIPLTERIRRIGWDPGVIPLLIDFLLLLRHIDDLDACRAALATDDWENASEHTDLTEKEFHDRVEYLWKRSTRLAEAAPFVSRKKQQTVRGR